MNTNVIKLKHPFKFDGVEFTEVEVRRPKGADLRDMNKKHPSEHDFFLMSRLCQKPDAFFDEMDGEDIMVISKKVRGFLSLG